MENKLYTKEEVLRLLDEQKKICAETCEDGFYYGQIINAHFPEELTKTEDK